MVSEPLRGDLCRASAFSSSVLMFSPHDCAQRNVLLTFDLLDQLHGVLVDFLPVALVVGEVEIRRRVHGTQSRVFNRLAHRGS